MTDNINPSHYKDGPFECIELSRLLSSDWGQAVQYCFRWQHKNGVEDLKKALWFVNDALVHGIPIYAVSDWADLASALFPLSPERIGLVLRVFGMHSLSGIEVIFRDS